MDNYNLDEVKMLMEKNLITPEVLKNILKSTTRRLELYDDQDDLSILKYLSDSELVPDEAKEEINKYLALYDSYNVTTVEGVKVSKEERKSSIILITIVILLLMVVLIVLLLSR